MSKTMNITAKATGEVRYIMFFEKGLLQTIHVVGPGFERRFYTRTPRMHEMELTKSVFSEIASNICKVNPQNVAELKEYLRADTEYYKILQKILTELFDQYKELILL